MRTGRPAGGAEIALPPAVERPIEHKPHSRHTKKSGPARGPDASLSHGWFVRRTARHSRTCHIWSGGGAEWV
jgi:hypothetical protein